MGGRAGGREGGREGGRGGGVEGGGGSGEERVDVADEVHAAAAQLRPRADPSQRSRVG